MPDKELKILEEIDMKLEAIVFEFIENYRLKVSKEIQEAILDFIDTLDNELTIKSRLARSKIINKFRAELETVIKDGAMADGYLKLIEGYKDIVFAANNYFALLSIKYEKELYRELFKESILFLKESLIGTGIADNIVNPIVNRIYSLNMEGITKKELKSFVVDLLQKNKGNLRYVEQITTDSLYQMTQNYQLKISEDLKIQYYYYAGSKMKTSRQFCISRYGKVFTKKEVQEWVSLEWSGKIVGTDKNSIFWFRGGYNCRHTLRPISKNLYERLK